MGKSRLACARLALAQLHAGCNGVQQRRSQLSGRRMHLPRQPHERGRQRRVPRRRTLAVRQQALHIGQWIMHALPGVACTC